MDITTGGLLILVIILGVKLYNRNKTIKFLDDRVLDLQRKNKEHQALWNSQHWALEDYNNECG